MSGEPRIVVAKPAQNEDNTKIQTSGSSTNPQPRSKKILPTLQRQEIYEEVCRLRALRGNVGPAALIRMLTDRFAELPSRQTLKRWMAGKNMPSTSMAAFEAIPSEELSFFLGAWLGDGWGDKADGGKRLLLKVRSHEFAEEFAHAATVILQKQRPYRARVTSGKTGTWFLVKVTSILLIDFVSQPFSSLTPYLDLHPVGFLRSIFTAEGNPSVSIQRRVKGPELALTICISNTNMAYINFVRNALMTLGLNPTSVTTGYKKGMSHPIQGKVYTAKETEWQFRLARLEEMGTFLARIGFADSIKQDKAITALDLIQRYGQHEAAIRWMQLFLKVGRKWFRV